MSVNQNEFKLVSILVQGILYAVFFVVSVLTLWTLVFRRPPGRRLNKAMLAVSLTMFVLATAYLVLNLFQIFQAPVAQRELIKSYWNQFSEPTHIVRTTIYFVQSLIGGGVALYRCWVVWGYRQGLIVIPSVFFLGSVVTGIGTFVYFSKHNDASILADRIWLISFFSFTLATSITCSVMIAARIWFLIRKATSRRQGLYPIVQIVLESGVIYPSTLIALFVLLALNSWFQYVLINSVPTIIGLVFSIIIIRVGLGITIIDGGASPPTNPFINDSNHPLKSINTTPHPTPDISQTSLILSPYHVWPVQPARPLTQQFQPQQRQRKDSKSSIFSFKRGSSPKPQRPQRPDQGHYTLRSQMIHPTSYFRTSQEIGVNLELEAEMDEEIYNHPKALPIALMFPRSDREFSQ